jgi:hypothetical protein
VLSAPETLRHQLEAPATPPASSTKVSMWWLAWSLAQYPAPEALQRSGFVLATVPSHKPTVPCFTLSSPCAVYCWHMSVGCRQNAV